MKLWIAVALLGCGPSKKDGPSDKAVTLTPAKPDAGGWGPQTDAPLEEHATPSTLRLPKRKILAADVVGKPRAQAVKAIGGKRHDTNPSMFIVDDALFEIEVDETGKVAALSITADSDMETTTSEQRELAAWTGAKTDEWTYDESLHRLVVWAPNARERSDERKRIGDILGDYMKRLSAGSGHARGEVNTTLLIRTPFGKPCNAGVLGTYRRGLEEDAGVSLAKLGFTTMQCDIDGPKIQIR